MMCFLHVVYQIIRVDSPCRAFQALEVDSIHVTLAFLLSTIVEITVPAQVMSGRVLFVNIPSSAAYKESLAPFTPSAPVDTGVSTMFVQCVP